MDILQYLQSGQGPSFSTLLAIVMIYFMPKLFKFLIHGREMHRDEVTALIKTLTDQNISLAKKVDSLDLEAKHWRESYYRLAEEHALIKSQYQNIVDDMRRVKKDLAGRPCPFGTADQPCVSDVRSSQPFDSESYSKLLAEKAQEHP